MASSVFSSIVTLFWLSNYLILYVKMSFWRDNLSRGGFDIRINVIDSLGDICEYVFVRIF